MKTLPLFTTLLLYLAASSPIKSYSLNDSEKDTSEVHHLIESYEELKYVEPDQAESFAEQALNLAKKLNFDRGIVQSKIAIGSILVIRSSLDSALLLFEEALILAQKARYRKGVMDALMHKGKTFKSMMKWNEAISNYEKCIEIAELGKGDTIIIATNHLGLGNVYLEQDKFIDALEHYQETVALVKNTDRLKVIALSNIGLIHFRLDDFDKALQYYLECLEQAEILEDNRIMAYCYQLIGVIKRNVNEYDEAKRYYKLAIQKFEILNEKTMIASLHTNIGNIYLDNEEYAQAIDEFVLSLEIQKTINDQVRQCHSLLSLGKSFLGLKEYQKAEDYFLQAWRLSMEAGVQLPKRDALFELSQLYAKLGNYQKAYEFTVELKVIDDSIYNETKSNQIAEMEVRFQSEQKEKEITLLNTENQVALLKIEKQENLRNSLIVIAGITVILAFVSFNRYQIKARSTKKLQELDQLKTKFFTNISHEFRTPLTLISSPVERMLKSNRHTENHQDLNLIKKNAKRLLELINQLLDLAKLEAGKLSLKVSKGDINQALRNTASSFESLATQKNIRFQISIDEAPFWMYFDSDKLQKILSNLLSNAFKFTPETGEVQIMSSLKNDQYRIRIKDSGPGILKSEQNQLFQRFHQLDSNSNQHPGTGIGLALTKELVELHHGEIELVSDLGQGTEFIVTLPTKDKFYAKDQIIDVETVSHELLKPLQSANTEIVEHFEGDKEELPIALIVEDNDDLRSHISSLLSKEYTVHEARNGKEGLETVFKLIPDVIISDLMMPEMDGLALCKEIKTDERSNHIPIILLTAKGDTESKLEGLQEGADDYLTKPFDLEELKARIQNLIDQRIKLRKRFSSKILVEPSKISIDHPDEMFLKKAIAIVEENISNVEFNVETFQREIGMSRMQLHRKLKALTNHSSSEFIRSLRLERAAQFLASGGMNVAETAYSSGFSSLSYFNQCFKEKFGVNPSKYSAKKA